MERLRYSEWADTALVLHLVSQMLGKTKLGHMEPQPEWGHCLLFLTENGFSTGLIPRGDNVLTIDIVLRESLVTATDSEGRSSSFAFMDGKPVSEYYARYMRMLREMGCESDMYTVPQEMATRTPFEQDKAARQYDPRKAKVFYRMCVFAHNCLLRFASPFRGKKILPAYFWGTFDVTTVLFSGKPAPFTGKGLIEATAFDEQLIEFGFWPGDPSWDEPSFFVLPYPFLTKDLTGAPVKPASAYFSKDKAEFFLPLREALETANPAGTVQEFLHSCFELLTREEGWERMDWFTKPLLASGRG